MKIICAWCNKQMSTPEENRDAADALISHSICPDCADNLDFQLGVSLERFVESVKVPVIVLDGEGRHIAANGPAAALLAAAPAAGCGIWSDKIYECAHARLPERCRQTIHCSGCTIRMVVTDTFRSGEAMQNVPAYLSHCSSDQNEKIELLISADKIGEIVYLSLARV